MTEIPTFDLIAFAQPNPPGWDGIRPGSQFLLVMPIPAAADGSYAVDVYLELAELVYVALKAARCADVTSLACGTPVGGRFSAFLEMAVRDPVGLRTALAGVAPWYSEDVDLNERVVYEDQVADATYNVTDDELSELPPELVDGFREWQQRYDEECAEMNGEVTEFGDSETSSSEARPPVSPWELGFFRSAYSRALGTDVYRSITGLLSRGAVFVLPAHVELSEAARVLCGPTEASLLRPVPEDEVFGTQEGERDAGLEGMIRRRQRDLRESVQKLVDHLGWPTGSSGKAPQVLATPTRDAAIVRDDRSVQVYLR